PQICRRYRCLWLAGALEEGDRPDRLGAVLDLASRGGLPELVVHEREPGALDASPRLCEIAETYRASMPVRVLSAAHALDAVPPAPPGRRGAARRWRSGRDLARRRARRDAARLLARAPRAARDARLALAPPHPASPWTTQRRSISSRGVSAMPSRRQASRAS